jgi:hypothetical protein
MENMWSNKHCEIIGLRPFDWLVFFFFLFISSFIFLFFYFSFLLVFFFLFSFTVWWSCE